MGGVGNLLAGVGQLMQQLAPVADAAAGGLGTTINNGLQVAQNVTNAVGQMANGNVQGVAQQDKAQQNQEAAVVDRAAAESLIGTSSGRGRKGSGKLVPPGQAKRGSGKLEPPGQAKRGSGELPSPVPSPAPAVAGVAPAIAEADFLAMYPTPTPPLDCPPVV